MPRFWTLTLLLSLFLTFSCGGDDDDEDKADPVADFEPCGGDPRGEWKADALHFTDASPLLELDAAACKDALHSVAVSVTGEVSIAMTTYQRDLRYALDLDVLLTTNCLRAFTGETDAIANDFVCNEVEDKFRERPAFASAACGVEKESCSCSLSSKERSSRQDAMYSIDGNNLVLGAQRVAFCVKSNDRFEHWFEDANSADLSGVLILTR